MPGPPSVRKNNMRLVKCFLLASALLSGAAIAQNAATVHQQLTQLAEDIVYTSARLFPTQATFLGITQYDAELEIPSEKNRAAYIDQLQQWKRRLHAIALAAAPDLSLVDRDDAKLLEAQLAQSLDALLVYQVDRKDYSIGANTIVNCIFLQLQFLPIAGRDGAAPATVDKAWAEITSRLSKAPEYIAESQRLVTHPGHLYGIVGSEELGGAPSFFNGALTDAAKVHYGDDSESLSRFLRARDATLAAIAQTRAYIDAHVAQWLENFAIGRQAYDRLLRDEQLLPFDSRDIDRMGNDELAHGWAEEAW